MENNRVSLTSDNREMLEACKNGDLEKIKALWFQSDVMHSAFMVDNPKQVSFDNEYSNSDLKSSAFLIHFQS